MAFLGAKEISRLQKEHEIISPFQEGRIKNASYELALGNEVYLTDAKTGKVEILNDNTNRQVDINPGQFALLLTAEKVNIPNDKIAFISIKAGEKLKGLVNVSGFHVDPGFDDHLLFSVYNAGPSTIVLYTGEPYFPIWFAELKTELSVAEAYGEENEHFGKLSHIPAKYIEVLKRGELASPNALLDKIKDVESQLNEKIIKTDERSDRNDWLIKILIGVVITLSLKALWDWAAYDRGYSDGKNAKLIKEQVIEQVKAPSVDSIISIKVDSILKTQKYDTTGRTH